MGDYNGNFLFAFDGNLNIHERIYTVRCTRSGMMLNGGGYFLGTFVVNGLQFAAVATPILPPDDDNGGGGGGGGDDNDDGGDGGGGNAGGDGGGNDWINELDEQHEDGVQGQDLVELEEDSGPSEISDGSAAAGDWPAWSDGDEQPVVDGGEGGWGNAV